MTKPIPNHPMCGWCNRPRLRDVDPATTVFLCDPHQAMADRMAVDLEKILVPRDQLLLPAGVDRWPTGIISNVPAQPEPAEPFDFEAMMKWIRLYMDDRSFDTGLETEFLLELQRAILPISPIELAIRLATIARTYFTNRAPKSTHTGWRVVWLSERGGIVLTTADLSGLAHAERVGPVKVGQYNIAAYEIQRREHEAYEDGSHFTGPWITVTSTLEPTTEEHQPCSETSES